MLHFPFIFFPPQLALKHRQGKNHKMRIIAFVGSPVDDQEKEVSWVTVYYIMIIAYSATQYEICNFTVA